MTYEIIKDKPPIWDKLKSIFPNADENTVAVTYGDKIYCKEDMSEDLLAHELTHVRQQGEMGRDIWWDRYLSDPEFVYEMELEAYRKQLQVLNKKYKDRNKQYRLKLTIAQILSGPLYNNVRTKYTALTDLGL